ncbi:hypothetical protein QE152_g40011 [Popillia japonica]|uniref:Regulatory protein RecX n=1 Tax=Popillia japonica TaxID=7064 RepID=A0AAW1HSL7_POPJA
MGTRTKGVRERCVLRKNRKEMCFTEEQKREIEKSGIMVIQFKLAALKMKKAVQSLAEKVKKWIATVCEWACQRMDGLSKEYKDATPRQRYKMVKRLEKCGFDEKQINLMVNYQHLSRDNC